MAEVTRFFHPVLGAGRLGRRPVRVLLDEKPYVLFRDGTGQPAALRDACPHRLAPLSAGRVRPDGRLECVYHGWHFDAAGRGCSPTQPTLTRCDVESFQVVERLGYLWMASRETPRDAFPTVNWDGFEFAGAYSVRFQAPLHVCLDNFSEDEHVPFVHTRLGFDRKDLERVEFRADNFDDRTEVHYRAPQRSTRMLPFILLRHGDVFHNDWVTRFDPVHSVYTIWWTDPSGNPRPFVTRAAIFMVPETARTTWFHVFSYVELADARFQLIKPMVKALAVILGRLEVMDDARFIPTVADTPVSMKGMRLGKYDKPLIHNRKLLQRIYRGTGDDDLSSVPHLTVVQ
ncbi:MAG: Rieske 2Fe-2S domain-containing protein [Myxococcota bacterium]